MYFYKLLRFNILYLHPIHVCHRYHFIYHNTLLLQITENIDNFKFINFNKCHKNEEKLFTGFCRLILLFEMSKWHAYDQILLLWLLSCCPVHVFHCRYNTQNASIDKIAYPKKGNYPEIKN